MRDQGLQAFLDALERAVLDRAPAGSAVAGLADAIFAAASAPAPDSAAGWMPGAEARDDAQGFVSETLGASLDLLAHQPAAVRDVAETFAPLAPSLDWARRPAGPRDPDGFRDAHANATVIGGDGIEARGDIRIGVSLLGQRITYPQHRHPPEEFYLVLSEGDFWNTATGWWTPGIGGLVHNPPGIAHAMRAGAAPLLAIWCLDSRPPAAG